MAAPAKSNMMGAAILRRAGQKAHQSDVNYSGTGQGSAAPQMAARPGAGILKRNPGTGMARPAAPAPPASPAVQRTSMPFNAGAQQRAAISQGAPRPGMPGPATGGSAPVFGGDRTGGGLRPVNHPANRVGDLLQRPRADPSRGARPMVSRNVVAGARDPRWEQDSVASRYGLEGYGDSPRVLDPTAGMQAHDGNYGGGEAADQSLMTAKTNAADDTARGLRQLFGIATGEEAAPPLNPGTGDGVGGFLPQSGAGPANPYSGLIGRIGGALFDPAAELSGAISDSVNTQVEDFDTKYMGNYDDASGKIRDAGAGLLDPNAQAAAEAAARDSMYSGINRQRDTAVTQMLDRSNRGGRTGSGSTQAAYDSAISAAQEGERGLIQDAFGRRLQATGAGASLLGQGAGMDYQKLRDYYMDPSKAMELLFAMGPDAMDALNPFPF